MGKRKNSMFDYKAKLDELEKEIEGLKDVYPDLYKKNRQALEEMRKKYEADKKKMDEDCKKYEKKDEESREAYKKWKQEFDKQRRESRKEIMVVCEGVKGADPELYNKIVEILEEKNSEAKKPEAKKPEAKKPEAKKPEAKKPDSKKTKDKKTDSKKLDLDKSEDNKATVRNYVGIENEYIHSINYQLDDWEIGEFESLKRELAVITDSKKKSEIRHKMAVILGKEEDSKYSQQQTPEKEETKKEAKQEKKESEETTSHKPNQKPIPTTEEGIRAEYEEMMEKIRNGKADKELYERYYQIKAEAEKLGTTVEEPVITKSGQEDETDMDLDLLPRKNGNFLTRIFDGILKKIERRNRRRKVLDRIFDLGDDELDTEQEKVLDEPVEKKTKEEKNPFHVLTDDEKEKHQEMVERETDRIQDNIGKNVRDMIEEDEKNR